MTRLGRALATACLTTALLPVMTLPGGPAGAAPPITKLIVYMLENTSQNTAYGSMPYLSGLAAQYGKATSYFDVTHPSEGNYVEMVSGQGATTCGLADPYPGQCNQPGGTVFGQALSKGLSAKLYQEGMDSNCSPSGDYGHNPWLHFPAEASWCRQFDVPAGETSGGTLESDIVNGTLPNAGMIVPDDSNNAHSGSLGVADAYLHGWMNQIFAGPDWRSGHLAVVITFDEGEATDDVAYVVVSPTVGHGAVSSGRANHDSTARLYSEVIGAPPMNHAATATDLAGPFNLGAPGAPALNQPIVGMAPTPSGQGYWLVAGDGGIFTFGDAGFHGSTGGLRLNQPIVGMAPTPSGQGYWLVAKDGGIFTFGDAGFHGALAADPSAFPVTAVSSSATGGGYLLVGANGAVYAFGNAAWLGNA
jgi:phosphatidylinositol-3-phosphatase